MARSLRKPSLVLVLAVLGLLLSIGLEIVHYRSFAVPSDSSFCSVGQRLDCTSVALSAYSVMLGVPLPIWGIAGFLAIAVAEVLRSKWLLPLSGFAALASLVLLGVELVAIGAVCLLCEGVHIVALAGFVAAFRRRDQLREPLTAHESALLVFGPAAGILLGAALFLKPYWGVFNWRGAVPFATGRTTEGYPWIGAEKPSLVVEEFTDYSCPHCKAASSLSLKHLAEHPSAIRIVRRQHPRMHCPSEGLLSCQMVRVAYCADLAGKFWQMDRWLFQHGAGKNEIDVEAAAKDVGLDAAALMGCVARTDLQARADREARAAFKLRIIETPTYRIGSKRLSLKEIDAYLRNPD
jgi:uncharacterized membrane protein